MPISRTIKAIGQPINKPRFINAGVSAQPDPAVPPAVQRQAGERSRWRGVDDVAEHLVRPPHDAIRWAKVDGHRPVGEVVQKHYRALRRVESMNEHRPERWLSSTLQTPTPISGHSRSLAIIASNQLSNECGSRCRVRTLTFSALKRPRLIV
jgi:hypothetical protein